MQALQRVVVSPLPVLRGQSWELSQEDTSRSSRGGSVGAAHVYKKRKLDPYSEKVTKWTTCSLSGESLTPPVVADFLGALYNKSAVLEFLLVKSGVFSGEMQVHRYMNQLRQGGDAFEHIKSSRDVFEVRLTNGQSAAAGVQSEFQSAYRCPLTDLPCERYPFCALASCGHVFSERAQKEMVDGACHLCNTPFLACNVIPLNGTAEQREKLYDALEVRRQQRKPAHKARNTAAKK